jgi:muramoyltetrapeptide carboxypeptidase LdcA involved in peptidoglycan recycling
VLETSEEVPPPDRVDAYLAELADAEVFDQIIGLVVARSYGYDQEQTLRLWSLVAHWTKACGVPVLGNVDCGHTDPMLTLPLGVRARLNATAWSTTPSNSPDNASRSTSSRRRRLNSSTVFPHRTCDG